MARPVLPPCRTAWVEIDLQRLANNFRMILKDKNGLGFMCVVKDEAYGHGAVRVARIAGKAGATFLGVVNLDEAWQLIRAKIETPIFVFGERHPDEYAFCLEHKLRICINTVKDAQAYARAAQSLGLKAPIHVEIDTGMGRYGIRWDKALAKIKTISRLSALTVEGIMTHFAMSDETDKSHAMLQLSRMQSVLLEANRQDIQFRFVHACNTGGYLDLPSARFNMVRLGILPLGVYPSKVCRRILGIQPIMQVKAQLAAIQKLKKGDKVGYGMRFTAKGPSTVGVIPLGYGDGYPRVRNQGEVLIGGKRAPIIGGNAMDAMMVDISHIANVKKWDEVVLQGTQEKEEISVHDIAELKGSVSYDILAGWRGRLPRVYVQ